MRPGRDNHAENDLGTVYEGKSQKEECRRKASDLEQPPASGS